MESAATLLAAMSTPAEADWVWQCLEQATGAAYRVVRVTSLDACLARLDAGGIDVVLLDQNLPDSTGLSTLQRTRERAPDVPIVVVATSSRDALALEAVRHGASGWILRSAMNTEVLDQAVRVAIERWRAESLSSRRAERLQLAVDGAGDGVLDWDLRSDTLCYSTRWGALLGLGARDTVAGPEAWFDRVHPDDVSGLRAALDAHLAGVTRRFEHEHRVLTAGGDSVRVAVRGRAERALDGRPRRLVGLLTDVTTARRADGKAVGDGLRDSLTGLTSRALFLDRVGWSLALLERDSGSHFAVLAADLDHFKRVNDGHGRSVGDRLLAAVADRLARVVRRSDTFARLGGDTFGVLLCRVADARVAVGVAERLQDELDESFLIDGVEATTSVSIGIALSSSGYETADELLRDADVAMGRAKSIGVGKFQVYDPELHRGAVELCSMEAELGRAVSTGAFVMHYQPIVSLTDGAVAGFESLVRWDHPELGLLPPGGFMAVAERTALIVPIGWWALREVCRQARVWSAQDRARALWLSVNISSTLILQVDVVDRVKELLEAGDLSADALRLELGESVLLALGEALLGRLRDLRGLGVRLVVDDFGLGYRSLNSMHLAEFDAVKIRPAVLDRLEDVSPNLAPTVLQVARELGLEIIAEGVETAEQAARLRSLGCPRAQGFWFSRPVDVAEATRLLGESPAWWAAPDAGPGD